MLSDLLMWNKIGRIVTLLSEQMGVDTATALSLFYRSETCRQLHEPETGLYLFGDRYVLNNLISEINS